MLRNMSIKPRAIISFGALAFIVLMLGILALVALSSMHDSARKVDQEMLPAIMSIGDISQDFHRLRAATLRVMLSRTKSDIQRDKLLVDELKSGIEIEERKYQALISASPEAKRLYERFDSAQKVYIDVQARVISSAEQGQLDQAIELVNSDLNPAGKNVADALSDLMQATQQQASEAAKQAKNVYEKTQIFIAISILVALVVTGILASAFSQSIVQPLRKAVQAAKSIAEQDLTQSIPVDGQDEPGQLLESLRLMQVNLQKAMQQISTSSAQVASAAEELSVASQAATHNLSQQGHEVDQAATAVNEMTAAVESVAVNAVETSDASKEADTLARSGQKQVQAAIQSLNGLNDDVAQTASNVELLAGRVQEITKVLDVIQTIAEQTNLLALNAAIEAARAGDAGRGFAVVADEVRGLAHRTQQSTQEIEQMIKDIQQGTTQAVSAMQGSQAKAVTTLAVAEQAGEVLAQIALAISRINERNLLIASASEEQAQVSREVDRNLVRIHDWSMQTSAGANQSHAASQALASLAVQLNQVVTRFRL